jgi:hypothetical protein
MATQPGLFRRLSRDLRSARGWRAAWLWALVAVLALRLGLGLMMGLTWVAVRRYLPPGGLTDESIYGGLQTYATFPADALLGVWQRWDGVSHLNLARLGYFGVPRGHSVYYPLYAFLTRVVSQGLRSDYVVGGLVVSTVAAVVTLACLYRLAERIYGPTAARWAVVTLSVYPTALFLIAPYTESLFLALTLGAFLAAYERRWWLAGGLGALASLTRGPGMLTSAALGWIAWRQWRTEPASHSVRWVAQATLGLVLPVLGGLAFTWWRASAGFPSMADSLRVYSGLEMTDPISGLVAAFKQLVAVQDLPVLLDVSSALLFLCLTVGMILNRRWRRGEWLIYVVANLGVFLSKRSLVASSLQSLPRYVLVLFPAFVVVGEWLSRRGPRTRLFYVVVSGALLLAFSALYALWFFIG